MTLTLNLSLTLLTDPRLRQLGYRLLLQVHDEVILEGPEQHVDEAMKILRQCMEHPFEKPLKVDLVVDAKAAKTWYDAK
eukprot:CAMPEP_0167790288 /NCGR_PEP_ID=MMETSP0111_2-20121227/11220_1 /TAXON_ID=91324 /ORGANISM="Lotharella globosa, Strain CCCM811" /LENGTH=78 /DNA_ID=CAMNT_0007682675 /DNA_START=232 /DNA_END=468 /DNA_ORIENTATION=-